MRFKLEIFSQVDNISLISVSFCFTSDPLMANLEMSKTVSPHNFVLFSKK